MNAPASDLPQADPSANSPGSAPTIRHHANEFADDEAVRVFENETWWYVGRAAMLRRLLDRARGLGSLSRIVEVGCGSGPHLALLAEYGSVTGVEPSTRLAERCRARGDAARVITGDLAALETSDVFDLACLFDVLEHIPNDLGFLATLRRHLAPGGMLLLSVPAHQWLYGPHDALLHHERRYGRRQLERLLADGGYRVLHGGFFLTALFPAAVLARLSEKVRAWLGRPPAAVNLGGVSPGLNRLLTRVLTLEAAVAARRPLPFGLWLMYLARRIEPDAAR